MSEAKAQRVHAQLPEALIFMADAMEQNPLLHFSTALELARNHLNNDVAELLDSVLRMMQVGFTPRQALWETVSRADMPAFTAVVAFIEETQQPDDVLITSATLRQAAAHLGAQ
jgi:Flp pilus assembly protein TadB